jgi:hypothetical protein
MEQHKVNIAKMTMMTTRCGQACGLNSLAGYFNVKACDIWEKRWQQQGGFRLSTSVP